MGRPRAGRPFGIVGRVLPPALPVRRTRARRVVRGAVRAAGTSSVESDAVRQPRGVVGAGGAARGAVLTGSHLDSVLDGGAYDGPLGVVSALAAVDVLRSRGFEPARPIGVSVFVEEEGSRFGLACLGSRLATGRSRGTPPASCGTATGSSWRTPSASGRGSGPRAGLAAAGRRRHVRRAARRAGPRPRGPLAPRSGSPAGSGRTGGTATSSAAPPTTPARPGWRTAPTRCSPTR